MKKAIITVWGFIFLCTIVNAQIQNTPPMRQVLSTTGDSKTVTLPTLGIVTFDYTVGECMVTTISATSPFNVKALTQGFQQPDAASNSLNENIISVNSTCIGASNGSVVFQHQTSTGPVTYNWNNNGYSAVSSYTNLAPGLYYYQITDGNFTINDSIIISEDQVECGSQLTFYKGITPNGDGTNDTWIIDGITNFSECNVLIYNRWGDLVWNKKNYDNVSVVWEGKNNAGNALQDATYFYLVEAGGKTYKGYVEITR